MARVSTRMRPLVLLIMSTLAAYRATRLITTDTILDRPRRWAENHLPDKAFELVTCPWCIGSWIAFATVAVTWRYVSMPLVGLMFPAVAASVGLIARWADD